MDKRSEETPLAFRFAAPMTLEAVALTQLDNLDAKLHSFEQQMRDDPNVESCWTAYNQGLGRKLFKGRDFATEGSMAAAECS